MEEVTSIGRVIVGGEITGYQLRLEDGTEIVMSNKELAEKVINKEVTVTNLKLTNSNR